jgi:hypothetical protein
VRSDEWATNHEVHTIKGQSGKLGRCAEKVNVLIWGGLSSGRKRQPWLRSQAEAAEVSRGHSTFAVAKGRAEHRARTSTLNSSRDEQGRPTALDRGTPGQRREVKLSKADQRVEPSPALSEGKANAELWDRVWARPNLYAALERVKRNGGAPGIDGMTVDELRPYLKAHWLEIRETLDQQTYQPSAVRRVEIPKPEGGVRLLGIPTVLDRLLQQAMAQALTPLFEPLFSPTSYGFRPGRSAHQAIQQAQD